MIRIAYVLPLVIVIFSNTLYHLISKKTPSQINPFAALTITYGVAFLGSMILFLLTEKNDYLTALQQLPLRNFLMGLVIIGVEGGYLLMYQKGWEVSNGSLIANICVAVLLFFLGITLFQEKVSIIKAFGIFLCIAGIVIMNF